MKKTLLFTLLILAAFYSFINKDFFAHQDSEKQTLTEDEGGLSTQTQTDAAPHISHQSKVDAPPSLLRPTLKRNAYEEWKQVLEWIHSDEYQEIRDDISACLKGELSEAQTKALYIKLQTQPFKQMIEQLQLVAQCDHCDFGVDYSKGFYTTLPHLSPIRKSIQILSAASKLELQHGTRDQAHSLLNSGLKIASFSSDGKTLISELIQARCFKTSLQQLPLSSNKNLTKQTRNILLQEIMQAQQRQYDSLQYENKFLQQSIIDHLIDGTWYDNEEKNESGIHKNARDVNFPELIELHWQNQYNLQEQLLFFDNPLKANWKTYKALQKEQWETVDDSKIGEFSQELLWVNSPMVFLKYKEHQRNVKMNLIAYEMQVYKQKHGSLPEHFSQLENLPMEVFDGPWIEEPIELKKDASGKLILRSGSQQIELK